MVYHPVTISTTRVDTSVCVLFKIHAWPGPDWVGWSPLRNRTWVWHSFGGGLRLRCSGFQGPK